MLFNSVGVAALAIVPVLCWLDRPSTVALLLVGLFLYQVYLLAFPRRGRTPLTYNPLYPVRLRAVVLRRDLE